MNVDFEIMEIPKGEQKKYPIAYVEGILKVFVGNVLFFNQSGILLIELAISIRKWLVNMNGDNNLNFIYVSMDNDSPILTINYAHDNYYRIHSIWQEINILEFLLKEDIIAGFEKYLEDLEEALKLKAGIELSIFFQDI